ncbi:hypothetical protein DD238_006223 [Peronospora effusa]|uniref:HTH CENPB-type domain-containing protein n=1 Tax=Peronospora effusa TaxID=542832 RepID=A0A3M6V980_9STRA|nr:hypothetical protein DD238_006223 [Peronospora effusa]RQM12686.1 hypothetical protein DD237_007059 [Peronospora effusa]
MTRRRPTLTTEQRLAIVRQSDRHPLWKQNQLGQWAADTFHLDFVPSQPTISIILRRAGKPVKSRGRKKKKLLSMKPKLVKCPQVEKAMLQWLERKIEKDEAVTVTAVQTKAQELEHKVKVTVEGFVASKMWVDHFIRHHVLNCPFGLSESEDLDNEEKVDVILRAPAVKKMGKKVMTEAETAGKTSGRVDHVLVGRKDSRTPVTAKVTCKPAGKRKRDGKRNELAKQSTARR